MMQRMSSQAGRDSFASTSNFPHFPNLKSTIIKPSSRKVNQDSLSFSLTQSTSQESKTISSILFPDLPEHYPLRKKIAITKSNSSLGNIWDMLQIFLACVACILYIADTYGTPYRNVKVYILFELIITQFFLIDFLLNWYIVGNISFLTRPMSLVDIVTILPVYITLAARGQTARFGFLRFARILRLARILRTFKAVRKISGVKKQILTLSITLLSLTFLAAGLVQVVESDFPQYHYDCQYINAATNWEPSCSSHAPADNTCDCSEHDCLPWYQAGDKNHEPSLIRCITLTYFDAFYFIIVTTATVGYGDIHPTNSLSRVVVMMYILISIIVIPVQLNKLQVLLAMKSIYRKPYEIKPQEHHVILCGFVNDKDKLSMFFKEFFHPDRVFSSSPEFHAVILCPSEPTEDVRSLISSPILDSRVTYVIGSALSVEDLKKVRADVASAMFFLCNTEIASSSTVPVGSATSQSSSTLIEDAATVMRALSVSNFNSELDCLVQVIRPEDRTILKDSDIDVILCLDEFKTALQARNSICPGFSTFIENIFHSFGSMSESFENTLDPWYKEYLGGARMEYYYLPLDDEFLHAMNYSYERICKAIYMEYGVIIFGLCSQSQDDIIFNPTLKDVSNYKSFKAYFKTFNVALIMADDQMQTESIARGLTDIHTVESMLEKINEEDAILPCHLVEESKENDVQRNSSRNQLLKHNHQNNGKRGEGYNEQKSHEKQEPDSPLSKQANFKLQAFNTIRNKFAGVGSNETINDLIHKREIKEVNEPLSDSDSDDGEHYFGYVQNDESLLVHNTRARKMSAELGGGMVGSTKKKGPALLASRKPYVNSPTVELDLSRKIFRNSLTSRRATDASVKEENEEEEEDDDDDEVDENTPTLRKQGSHESNASDSEPPSQPKPLLQRFTKMGTSNKITIISPSALSATPLPDKKKPKPMVKSSTVSTNIVGSPKVIRPTLKALSDKSSPHSSPVGSPTTENRKSLSNLPPKSSEGKKKVFNRGSTSPALSSSQSPGMSTQHLDQIPSPPSEPPPIESPEIISRPRLNSDDWDPLSSEKHLGMSSAALPIHSPSKNEVSTHLKPSQIRSDSPEKMNGDFGHPSKVVDNVTVKDHIVVSGKEDNLAMFVSELRRPSVRGSAYHPIVIVNPIIPSKWDVIKGRYNDVYLLVGSLTRSMVFNRVNISNAFAVILLASGESVAAAQEENIDSTILFAYLKLEQYIPRDVFFSVELTCSANVAVLNATIMRRARRNPAEYFKTSHSRIKKAEDMNDTPEQTTKKTISDKESLTSKNIPVKPSRAPIKMAETIDPITNPEPPDAPKLGKQMKTVAMRQTLYHPISTVSISKHGTQRSNRHLNRTSSSSLTTSAPHSSPPAPTTPTGRQTISPFSGSGTTSGSNEKSYELVIQLRDLEHKEENEIKDSFWDATDTHHMLPIFASARAYVPSSFESLLVQSFFSVLTPLICEKLVCGQNQQAVLQTEIPKEMIGRKFLDLFRIMIHYHIVCFGIYRAPSIQQKAILPYVFISPPPSTLLCRHDKIFVYGKPSRLSRAMKNLSKILHEANKKPVLSSFPPEL